MPVRKMAEKFARNRHEGQKYGDHLHAYHLEQTVHMLQAVGVRNQDVMAAAWLHDVVEDTDTTLGEIHSKFGPAIHNIVRAVTDPPGKKNRAERKAVVFQQIKACPISLLVKLADRLANLRACYAERNEKLLKMYQKEWEEFRLQLHSVYPGVQYEVCVGKLWYALDFLHDGFSTEWDLQACITGWNRDADGSSTVVLRTVKEEGVEALMLPVDEETSAKLQAKFVGIMPPPVFRLRITLEL